MKCSTKSETVKFLVFSGEGAEVLGKDSAQILGPFGDADLCLYAWKHIMNARASVNLVENNLYI